MLFLIDPAVLALVHAGLSSQWQTLGYEQDRPRHFSMLDIFILRIALRSQQIIKK